MTVVAFPSAVQAQLWLNGERYKITMTITADGRYTATSDAVMVDSVSAEKLKGADAATRRRIEEANQRVATSGTDPGKGVRMAYLGDARYEIHQTRTGTLPKPGKTEKTIIDSLVFVGREDTVEFTDMVPSESARAQEAAKRGKLRVTSEVCVKTDLPVLETNALERPALPDGCYLWRQDGVELTGDNTRGSIVMRRPIAATSLTAATPGASAAPPEAPRQAPVPSLGATADAADAAIQAQLNKTGLAKTLLEKPQVYSGDFSGDGIEDVVAFYETQIPTAAVGHSSNIMALQRMPDGSFNVVKDLHDQVAAKPRNVRISKGKVALAPSTRWHRS